MIHFVAPRQDADVPVDYITRADLQGRATVLVYEDLIETEELPHGLYVFTGINRLGPSTARLFAAVHECIESSRGIPPLNHPTRTLRRYELLRALYERGLNPFNAYGAWEDYSGVRFPAFVRPREADGGIPVLLHTLRQVESRIGEALMEGWKLDDLIVVEFEDTSAAGTFTKYSAYVVGGRIAPTSFYRGSHWVMRRHSAHVTAESIDEEKRYLIANPHEDQLADIFSLAHTSYGRMDYSIVDGRVVCWEINTLPLLRQPSGVKPLAPELQERAAFRRAHFAAAFGAAFAEMSAGMPEGAPIRPSLDPALVTAARDELATRGAPTRPGEPRFRFAKALLRPLKPILKPIAAATLQPMMARRARRTS